jgi:hypothetical protein
MSAGSPLKVKVDTEGELLTGSAHYRGLDRAVELLALPARPDLRIKTLALGKLTLTLESSSQRLLGLLGFTPSGRWATEGAEPPPAPDAEGALCFTVGFSGDDFLYADLRPRYEFDEDSACLRLRFSDAGALAVRAGNCLIAGISRSGELTDLWLERLKFLP